MKIHKSLVFYSFILTLLSCSHSGNNASAEATDESANPGTSNAVGVPVYLSQEDFARKVFDFR